MTEVRGIESPQHLLWSVGTSLIEAGPEDAETRLLEAIEAVSRSVGAVSCGLFESEPSTNTNRMLLGVGVDEKTVGDVVPGAGGAELLAGEGHAVVGFDVLFGADYRRDTGWPDGQAIVSLIEEGDDRVVHLVTTVLEPSWGDGELELLRGFGLLVRQFHRRIAAERVLGQRRELDRLALRLADELQGMNGADFDAGIDTMLRDVMDAFGGHAVFLVDAIDDQHFDLPVLLSREMNLPPIGPLRVEDINAMAGLDARDVFDLFGRTRLLDATALTAGLVGEDADSEPIERDVVLVPAEVAGFAGTAIGLSRPSVRPWLPFEIDALGAIVSMVAQARARCLAEIDSQARFALQQVLTDVGQRFVQVDADDAASTVDVALRDVAESLGASFAFAGRPAADGEIDLLRVWVGPVALQPRRTPLRSIGVADGELVATATVATGVLDRAIAESWQLDAGPYRLHTREIEHLGIRLGLAVPTSAPAIAAIAPEALASLGDLASQLQLRVDAEIETSEQLAIEAVLSDVADDFLGGSARSAVAVETRAIERVGTLLGLHGLIIRGWGDDATVERVWRSDAAAGPGPSIGDPASQIDLLPGTDNTNRPVEWLGADVPTDSALHRLWGGDADALVAPVVVSGDIIAGLSAIRPGGWTDRDRGVLKSAATMLGQFRSRVRAEQRDELRLRSEQLIGDFAAELADATSDSLASSVNAAFMNICDAMGLTCLTIWRIDQGTETYRPVYRAVPSDGLGATPPTARRFGTDASLDQIREADGWVIGAEPGDPEECLNVLGFRRGTDGRESILVTKSRDTAPWTPESRELFREVSGVLNDVEARIAAERYVDAAFDNAPVGIVLRDEELKLITCNEAFAGFLGCDDPSELVGTVPDDLYADGLELVDWVDNDGRLEAEGAFKRVDGGRVWGHMRATAVEGDAGEHFWLIHVENITDRRRAEALLRFQATHDDLTGLANRGRLMQELDELGQHADGAAVLLLDLDRFKNINDSLGHDRGDELLVAVADRLRLAVRPGDLVARLGGDEFAVALAGPVTPTDAEFVANRLLRLIGEPILLGSQRVYPSASIGIAFSGPGGVADLMRRADTAMYRAKAQGRAQAALFDEALQLEVTERMATEAGLRGGLRNGEFLVHYQPEVSLVDGSMVGAEALVRWNHPTDGVLPAGAFIEVAEETGLVVDIGEFVLAEAVAQAATWPGGDDGPVIRVNLAAAQLQRDDTVALVRFVLHESGLAPHRLCLEITESAVMTDIRRSEQILHRLKELGVELAVDDFGTGFSSLAYLKRFPVDALKIDRAFVMGLGADEDDRTFVSSIISLADALGLGVVAEGVETEAQAEVLAELGCQRAQGYLFAKPGPVEELQSFLQTHRDA